MATVLSIADAVQQRFAQAISTAFPDAADSDPQLRRSDRADFQANGIMSLAKPLRANPVRWPRASWNTWLRTR